MRAIAAFPPAIIQRYWTPVQVPAIRVDADRSELRHADEFSAPTLAIHAAQNVLFAEAFVPAPPRRHRLSAPSGRRPREQTNHRSFIPYCKVVGKMG
jgi:hypothetical protein